MALPDGAVVPRRVLLLAWWLVTAVVAAAGSAGALRKIVHHDVGYWIDAAGRLLDGALLYRDLIELNPPTNYAVTLLPVALARAIGLDPVVVFHAFVLVLALLAAVMSAAALRRVLDDAVTTQLAMLPLAIVFLALPHHDFGQREHILAMLLLPYLLLGAARKSQEISLRLAAGALAGAVVAYKPYFILYPVAAEAVRLLHERRLAAPLRVESVTVVAVAAAAAIATVLAFPDYTRFIIPLGRAVYHGFEAPLDTVLLQNEFLLTAAATGAAILFLRHVANDAVRRCISVLLGAAIAGLIIYVAQMKGWRYHALPALMLAATALGLLLADRVAERFRDPAGSRAAFGAALALLALIAAIQLHAGRSLDDRIRAEIAPLLDVVRREAKGGPVLFLSTHLNNGFPVLNYAGISWRYRYHHLLPLPGLYDGFQRRAGRAFRAPGEMTPTEAAFFATVVEDALRFPPRMILVDRRTQIPPISELEFDLLAYFQQDPRFDALLRGYRPAGRVTDHDIYVRRE